MTWVFSIIVFLAACLMLSWLSSRLVNALIGIAKYLRWREFIIAFFVMAFAASLPNLFVDLGAAFRGIPQLAFGDIIGGNLTDLTLVMAIAIFFSKRPISTESDMVQKSALAMVAVALLPLLLVADGRLDRIDGLVLLAAFFLYTAWLFSKKERFKKYYRSKETAGIAGFRQFAFSIVKAIVFLVLLFIAGQIVVGSAQYFSSRLGVSISLVGILIIGLGNCFPETYFSIVSARQQENWMVLGDLIGSVMVCSTLVLGTVALVMPFTIEDFSPFLIARIFLVAGSVIAVVFMRSGHKVTKREGLILLAVYITFLLVEIFAR